MNNADGIHAEVWQLDDGDLFRIDVTLPADFTRIAAFELADQICAWLRSQSKNRTRWNDLLPSTRDLSEMKQHAPDEWNGQPIGECHITSYPDHRIFGSGSGIGMRVVHVERADPLIRVTTEMLEAAGIEGKQVAELGFKPAATFDGEVLTINGDNRHLVYRAVAGTLDAKNRTVVMQA